MIGTRVGAALAIVISIGALALAVVAFMADIRGDAPKAGRLVQTRLTNGYDGPPVAFVIDDFFIGRASDGRLHAWYAYPPGFYGHVRGCRLVWDAAATVTTVSGAAGPGLFVDPCGGARFDRDGRLVSGPADRDLDEFATSPAVEGMLVDTRRLLCGAPLRSRATPQSGAAETPTPLLPTVCPRVSPDASR